MPIFLQVPDNPYLNSSVLNRTIENPTLQQAQEAYLRPYHAAELVEPLLSDVHASQWTQVISDDTLFKHLLTVYFLYVHRFSFSLHKDLFLKDMRAGRKRFCSSLLVNAVLAAAYVRPFTDVLLWLSDVSQFHDRSAPERSKFWLPDNLGYKFMAGRNGFGNWSLLEKVDLRRFKQQSTCIS